MILLYIATKSSSEVQIDYCVFWLCSGGGGLCKINTLKNTEPPLQILVPLMVFSNVVFVTQSQPCEE